MANPYQYPAHFVADPNGTKMKCPSCYRVHAAHAVLPVPKDYERHDDPFINNHKNLVKHQRSKEHTENLKLARLLDLGYDFRPRRRITPPNLGPFSYTSEPLTFVGPLRSGYEVPHETYRKQLTNLWDYVLAFFCINSVDAAVIPTARMVRDPKVRATQELERFRKAREIELAGPIEGETANLRTWKDGEGKVTDITWPGAEPERAAWRATGDPVEFTYSYSERVRRRGRYRTEWYTTSITLFKRTALDRLVEWSQLFMNELDRQYFNNGINASMQLPRDMLHILMVLSVPHEEGWGRSFGIYGQPGRKRTYLKHQPTDVITGSVIKL